MYLPFCIHLLVLPPPGQANSGLYRPSLVEQMWRGTSLSCWKLQGSEQRRTSAPLKQLPPHTTLRFQGQILWENSRKQIFQILRWKNNNGTKNNLHPYLFLDQKDVEPVDQSPNKIFIFILVFTELNKCWCKELALS